MFKKLFTVTKPNYQKAKSIFQKIIEKSGIQKAEAKLNKLCYQYPQESIRYKKAFFSLIKDIDTELAVEYGEEIIQKENDPEFIKVLATRYKWLNNIKRHNQLIKRSSPIPLIKKDVESFIQKKKKFSFIEAYIEDKLKKFPEYSIKIKKLTFTLLKDIYTKEVLHYAEDVINEQKADEKFKQVFEVRKKRVQRLKLAQQKNTKIKSFDNQKFKTKIENLLKDNKKEPLEEYIDQMLTDYKEKELLIAKGAFTLIKDAQTKLSLKYAHMVIQHEKKANFIQVVLKRVLLLDDIPNIKFYANLLYKLTKDKSILEHLVYANHKNIILQLTTLAQEHKQKSLNKILDDFIENNLAYKHQIYSMLSDIYSELDTNQSIIYAKKSLQYASNEKVLLKLFDLQIKKGYLCDALTSTKSLTTITDSRLESRIHAWSGNYKTLQNGFVFPRVDTNLTYTPKNKSLYLLYNSLPYHSGGYATRSHGLMTGINSTKEFEVQAISRLGYPKDILRLTSDKHIPNSEYVDDILYHRLKTDSQRVKLTYQEYTQEYAQAVIEIAQKEKPFIIHAASNFYNGLACVYAAKKLGVKSIYEVRGLWEITRISREPEWKQTEMFQLNANMETEAAKNADIVITITQALKDEMISRGVEAHKIEILPNGVVTERFKPLKRNEELSKELGVEGKTVIGFIGSFVQYEGLEYLVDAAKILIERDIHNLLFLMVGDGAVWEEIQEKVHQLSLQNYFIFTGRVPHDEVEQYYSLVDITPFPRKGQPVCEMVSPLKPFEAMAMEKAVLASNVAALAEIVKDGYNGLLFEKDNIEDLANQLEKLIKDENLRNKLGQDARAWVKKERDWKVISQKLNTIYSKLLN